MKELIVTGKTVDEAVEKACQQLGLSRDDVHVEIIESPKRRLFGSIPAKVRVTENEDNISVKDLLFGNTDKPEKKEKTVSQNKPAEPERKSAAKAEQPVKKAEPEIKSEPVKKEEAQPVSQPDDEPEEVVLSEDKEEIVLSEDELSAPAKAALDYYKQMAHGMGADKLTYKVVKTERGVKFVIDGDDASLVIGRRGETMDSMQYLCMLVSSRTEGEYCKITVDVSEYRSKREKALIGLAKKEADKVLKNGYSRTLEPMNPYERRIVHSAIQEIPGVKSESTGVDPHRRVVISAENGGKTRSRSGGKGRGDRRGGNSSRREKKPAETYTYEPSRPADESNSEKSAAAFSS